MRDLPRPHQSRVLRAPPSLPDVHLTSARRSARHAATHRAHLTRGHKHQAIDGNFALLRQCSPSHTQAGVQAPEGIRQGIRFDLTRPT